MYIVRCYSHASQKAHGLVQDPSIKEPEAVQEMLHIDPERETVDPEPSEGRASIFHREFCKAVEDTQQQRYINNKFKDFLHSWK